MAQLTLNNRTVTVIKELVYYVNFSRHSNLFNTLRKSLQAKVILQETNQFKKIYKEIIKNIKYQQKCSKLQINKKRIKKSQLKKRNKIYLFIKNLRTL